MRTHNIINRSDRLHEDAGTFYHNYYGDAEAVFALFDSYCWAYQLILEESLDAAKLFYRNTAPVLHRDIFLPITVSEKEYIEGKDKVLLYGEDDIYYGQSDLYYGISGKTIDGAVKLPNPVVDCDLCTDLPIDPNVICVKSADFRIVNGYLLFERNLFDMFPSIGMDGNRTCTIWLRSAYSDRHYIQDRLGMLTKTTGESSESYRRFCNRVLDCLIEGTTPARLNHILCSIFDVPCANADETVELTGTSNGMQFLCTDKNVYWAPLTASFRYGIGDTIFEGDILTDAVVLITKKNLKETAALFIERRFMGSKYKSGLAFPTEEVKLTAEQRFPIVGIAEDIDRFWKTLETRSLQFDSIFGAMPGNWVNPADFLYRNAMYPRLKCVIIDIAKTGHHRLPMSDTNVLWNVTPPGVMLSLQIVHKQIEMEDGFHVSASADAPCFGMKKIDCSVKIVFTTPV